MAFQTTEKPTKVTTRNVFCQRFPYLGGYTEKSFYPYLDSPQNCPLVLIHFKAPFITIMEEGNYFSRPSLRIWEVTLV